MRFQVMSVLTACPNHVSSDFRNISNGVKRWTRLLNGKGNDKEHCDFMVRNFQCHMEDGLFHVPVADVLDLGDCILQWGSLLDRKRNEPHNYFPSPTTSPGHRPKYTYKYWGKSQEFQRNPITASSHSPTTGSPNQYDVPYMHILWQGTARRLWLENVS